MRKLNLVCSLVGAAALLSSCASNDAEQAQPPQNVREEVRAEPSYQESRSDDAAAEAAREERMVELEKEDDTSIVDRVRARFGGCDREVMAKSPGAAANPCLTTAQFMKDEGLSDEQVKRVNRYAARFEERDAQMAH